MAGHTLIVAILPEDSECGRKTAFQKLALLVRVIELGRSRELGHLNFRLRLTDARLMRSSGGGHGDAGALGGLCIGC